MSTDFQILSANTLTIFATPVSVTDILFNKMYAKETGRINSKLHYAS